MVFVININNTGTKQGFTTCFIHLVQQQHVKAGLHKYRVPDCPGGYSCMVTHTAFVGNQDGTWFMPATCNLEFLGGSIIYFVGWLYFITYLYQNSLLNIG